MKAIPSPIDTSYSQWSVIFFDDVLSSIDRHIKLIKNMGFNVIAVNNIVDFLREVQTHDRVVTFIDMYMPDLKDFSEIGFPQIKTSGGDSVAIAVIRVLLPKIGLGNLPAFVLSEYDEDDDAKSQIRRANINRSVAVGYIPKLDFDETSAAVGRSVVSFDTEKKRRDLKAATIMLGEWFEGNDAISAKILGFELREGQSWDNIVNSELIEGFTDIYERSGLIIYIKECFVRIFGLDAVDKELRWLNEPDDFLPTDKSPMDLLTSGRLPDIAAVAGLLRRVAG